MTKKLDEIESKIGANLASEVANFKLAQNTFKEEQNSKNAALKKKQAELKESMNKIHEDLEFKIKLNAASGGGSNSAAISSQNMSGLIDSKVQSALKKFSDQMKKQHTNEVKGKISDKIIFKFRGGY